MEDKPGPSFDPARLKRERHDADLGASEETGHDHVAHEPANDAPGDASANPTSGATPPAR